MEKDTENAHIASPPANITGEVLSRIKLHKEEKKQKKKAKREEEFLINLRKPKDTKVVLADRMVVERLLECLNNNSNCRPKYSSDYPLDSKDFPELSETCSNPKNKSISSKKPKTNNCSLNRSKTINLDEFLALEKNTKEPKNVPHAQKNECQREMCSRDTNSVSTIDASLRIPSVSNGQIPSLEFFSSTITHQEPYEPRKIKTRKKKDPIVLNIGELIVNKKQQKKNKLNMHNSKFRRGGENYYLSGNMLDSSNPRRKRGKHRENKRKKLTKLKFAIIRDRILKFRARKVTNCADTGNELAENENFDIKVGVDEYLSDLINKKLKFQKKKIESEKTIQKETVFDRMNIGKENETDYEEKSSVNADGKDDHSKEDNQTKKSKNSKKYTKFREYCENIYKEDLDLSVNELIEGIVYLQDKAFARDPIKARAKRRFVTGFREVQKYLMLKKIKILIIAPDLEAQESVFNKVEELKRAAASENVPCIFALNRRKLGYVSKKNVPVSVFGILNYEGLENRVEIVKVHLKDAQTAKLKSECIIKNDEISNNKFSESLLKLISDK